MPGLFALALLLPLRETTAQGPDAGARWAFTALSVTEPTPSGDRAWDAHPIDRFVMTRLAAAELLPNPQADRRTLLRRASFVLTGLPPSPEALAGFEADQRPDAFERVLDALLASPHYGEQQARHWLDLARYSDSNGLDENLAFANAFRYRDWVVKAHNEDMPFDRFGAMQIAGDLLASDPAIGLDGHLATGFLALGPRMLAEQDKEKLVLDTVDEQIDLVGRTFLGLTVGCARCHDHKFDPISQRDYYALAGIFRSTKSFRELGHVSQWFDRELAPSPAIELRQQREAELARLVKALDEATSKAAAAQRAELVADTGRYLLAGSTLLRQGRHVEAESARATSLHRDSKTWGSATCTVLHTHQAGPQYAEWDVKAPHPGRYRLDVRYAAKESRPMQVLLDGAVVQERALEATTGDWMPAGQAWHAAGELVLGSGSHVLRLQALQPHVPHLDALLLTPVDFAVEPGLLPPVVRQTAAVLASRSSEPLVGFWTAFAACGPDDFASAVQAHQGRGGLAAILLGGLPPTSARDLAVRFQTLFATAAAAAGDARTRTKEGPVRLPEENLEAARALLFDSGGLFALKDAVLRPYLPATTLAELSQRTAAVDAARAAVPPAGPIAMCVAEDSVRDLPVHLRGNHLTLEARATPRGFLSAFDTLQAPAALPAAESGRRELASWLFDPRQGLVLRVLSNRIWQRAFGEGLVRSPSNFGTRGDRPVHLPLLDWLAADLQAHGWSQKHLWRRILTSRTWQQTCSVRAEAVLRDPDNRLLWRQQRRRLQAESVRDAMLAVAGTLDRKLGGSLLGTGDRGYVTNDQSNDQARYDAPRRSLYLPIIRNAMFDLFAAFDYADPSVHLEQRPSTAVATQALLLLNAPFVRDQSKAFAARGQTAGADDETRIAFLWQQAYGRAPSTTERQHTARWLATARQSSTPEAALRGLCQTLFASNEFLHID
ncbi:MAG TPA: DUF1553 domain-containing protein [Planctomycetota bacterium]|nr:DUF1553 domain-containing protein [Planctomycetota bacterium]